MSKKNYSENADNLPQDEDLLKIHQRWQVQPVLINGVKLRAGCLPHKTDRLKANVLYLEGLADSMFNHDRLLNTLSEKGYRIIAFDYPGQGGSEGSMDQTRIMLKEHSIESMSPWFKNEHQNDQHCNAFLESLSGPKIESKTLLIDDMADKVWEQIKESHGIDSDKPIDVVIGWSTGGLAAYYMAHNNKNGLQAVVLIAPGTNTKLVTHIKTSTLNSNRTFMHLDNIRPDSPLKIPGFSLNLIISGKAAQNWMVNNTIKGLVLLSSPEKDEYVKSKEVESTLIKNNHFEFVKYINAAHEIDNETDTNRASNSGVKLETKVVEFLDNIFSR